MKQNTKQFELKFIRTRNAIERKTIVLARKALTIQYKSFLERAKQTDFRQWPQLVDTISEEPIKQFFQRMLPMNAKLSVMVRNNMLKSKATEEDLIYESIFQNKLAALLAESGTKITTITSTSRSKILDIIRQVIDEGETEGIGIPEMTSRLYKQLGANLRGNGYARAKAIAQTEVISASNQAAEIAAQSTGYEYKRYWSTSGLTNIRETHIFAEQYSNEKGGLKQNEMFDMGDGTFMKFPGDPNGTPENIINCRCTILHEIV